MRNKQAYKTQTYKQYNNLSLSVCSALLLN